MYLVVVVVAAVVVLAVVLLYRGFIYAINILPGAKCRSQPSQFQPLVCSLAMEVSEVMGAPLNHPCS